MPAAAVVARVQLSWRIAAFFCSSAARSALSLSALSLSRAFFFFSRSDSGAEAPAAAVGVAVLVFVVVMTDALAPPAGLLMMSFAGVPGGGAMSLICSCPEASRHFHTDCACAPAAAIASRQATKGRAIFCMGF